MVEAFANQLQTSVMDPVSSGKTLMAALASDNDQEGSTLGTTKIGISLVGADRMVRSDPAGTLKSTSYSCSPQLSSSGKSDTYSGITTISTNTQPQKPVQLVTADDTSHFREIPAATTEPLGVSALNIKSPVKVMTLAWTQSTSQEITSLDWSGTGKNSNSCVGAVRMVRPNPAGILKSTSYSCSPQLSSSGKSDTYSEITTISTNTQPQKRSNL